MLSAFQFDKKQGFVFAKYVSDRQERSVRTQYPFLENTLSLSTEKLALKNEGLIFFCTFIYD